jgi:hypothetical protein
MVNKTLHSIISEIIYLKVKEKLVDIKRVNGRTQYNGKKEKVQNDNNDLYNST